MADVNLSLPPGQVERLDFPRFGLPAFARRFPKTPGTLFVKISGDVEHVFALESLQGVLPRVEQVSDFHCVTTWTTRGLRWGGVRFADFYAQVVVPQAVPHGDVRFVVVCAQDGYRSILPLQDLLAEGVLLADQLDGQALNVAHGAPLRLVAPAHYGYKNVKYIQSLEFLVSDRGYRPVGWRFMAHPRARVALQERGMGVPAWLLRAIYRRLVGRIVGKFAIQ